MRESKKRREKITSRELGETCHNEVASTASSTMLDIKDYSPPLTTTAQRISRRLWDFGNVASHATLMMLMNACHGLS